MDGRYGANIFEISFHVMNWHDDVKCFMQISEIYSACAFATDFNIFVSNFVSIDVKSTLANRIVMYVSEIVNNNKKKKYMILKRKEIVIIFYFMVTTVDITATLRTD